MHLSEKNKNINLCLIERRMQGADRADVGDVIYLGFQEAFDIAWENRIIYLQVSM